MEPRVSFLEFPSSFNSPLFCVPNSWSYVLATAGNVSRASNSRNCQAVQGKAPAMPVVVRLACAKVPIKCLTTLGSGQEGGWRQTDYGEGGLCA